MSDNSSNELWAYSWYSDMDCYEGPYDTRVEAIEAAIAEETENEEVYLRRMERIPASDLYAAEDLHDKANDRMHDDCTDSDEASLIWADGANEALQALLNEWADKYLTVNAFHFVGDVDEVELPAPKEGL